jgi:predicted pyridoxine 5'-phosphate oxidase superfamily flavin-nucleotide-binding protein
MFPSDVAFTPAVKAIQERKGSREGYARLETGRGWRTNVTQDLAAFVAGLDMFYLGTATSHGQPYIQYRGGPPGFLKVLDNHTLGFADFAGNHYPADAENAILFAVEAWDGNCPQHIHKRFSQRQLAPVIEELQDRIAELEAEVARLRPGGDKSQGE